MEEEKTKAEMVPCAFEVGDKVVYKDILATIDRISPVFSYEYWLLSLTSVEDEEMTTTAPESECQLYTEDDFDADAQSEALLLAKINSNRIQNMVDGLTDKYFRDGNH